MKDMNKETPVSVGQKTDGTNRKKEREQRDTITKTERQGDRDVETQGETYAIL